MRAHPAFDRDPYLTELDTVVLRTGADERGDFAVLADTILYPEGGGQPSDLGTLAGTPVREVQKRDGEIRHYTATMVPPGPVRVVLDWARRFDHMQQHTGQHILTALAQERFGWATTAFHLGDLRCDVELATPAISAQEAEALEEALAVEIRAARAVRARQVTADEYNTLPVRSRGLPEGHAGDIRLVEIAGLDLNTCGGTHLHSTAELELVKLLGTEPLRGGTRLFFVAGGRARRRMEAHERRNAALRTLVGSPDEELVAGVEAKLGQLKEADRRTRALEEEVAALVVARLAREAGALAEHHFEDKDAAFLQKVGRQLATEAPAKAVFLTASRQGVSCFVLAAGSASTLDTAQAGPQVAALLDARGGGAKGFFQGKADSLAGRVDAVARLRKLCAQNR